MKIQYKDTSILNKEELTTLKTISRDYNKKFENHHNILDLMVDIKIHQKGGTRKRYQIIILSQDRNFSTNVEDWDLSKTLHKAFKKIISESNHKERILGKPSRDRLKSILLKTKGIFKK